MPYAAKATVEFAYTAGRIELYATFNRRMQRYIRPLTGTPPAPLMPLIGHWGIMADTSSVDVASSSWLDEWTLQLITENFAPYPTTVTLEYLGPDPGLKTAWDKQWEPFGPILAIDLTKTLWKTGMILLWSGSIATIPMGWVLCNGSNGTPDLRSRFVTGAGGALNPGDNSPVGTHTHTLTYAGGGSLASGTDITQVTPNGQISRGFNFSGGGTTAAGSSIPPYYALCYIMKL